LKVTPRIESKAHHVEAKNLCMWSPKETLYDVIEEDCADDCHLDWSTNFQIPRNFEQQIESYEEKKKVH
jgi:hypothetical protein